MVVDHELWGSEISIVTDNSTTAEAAFWKGTSKSEALFELVLRLKELELDYNMHLQIVHVSGKRMIAEGTDGLSRADHGEGVILGKSIRYYIPLHLNPIGREPKIKSWIEDVTRGLNFQILKSSGWFDDAHNMGNVVWNVPSAAGGGSGGGTVGLRLLETARSHAHDCCASIGDREMEAPLNPWN
jgi:hypothetical protein